MGSLFRSTRNTRLLKGGSITEPRFIRSDAPCNLSREEIQWLIDRNILTVVDLRQENEVAAQPCLLSERPEFTYYNIPVTTGNTFPELPEQVGPSYLRMVDDVMSRIIALIESAETGVLYFCAAGKDRTGVVSALLLKRAGAGRQVIVDDYTASYENLKDMIEEWCQAYPTANIDVITPRASYMEQFLDNVKF